MKARTRTSVKKRKKGKKHSRFGMTLHTVRWRGFVIGIVILCVVGVISLRLYTVQVLNHEDYRVLATNQHQVTKGLVPIRGEVFLQNNNVPYPIAINREYKMAYAIPQEIEDARAVAGSIAGILSLDEDVVHKKLIKENDVFEILKHRLNDEEVSRIQEADFEGIAFLPETFRYYPAGELAAQTIGFVGSDGEKEKGRYGVEAKLEDVVAGTHGSLTQERSARGTWLSVTDRLFAPAHNGEDVVLTMSYPVQFEVEKIVKEAVEEYEADSGSIIVMEPATGKILALANYPSFDPNNFGSVEDANLFKNSAISIPYESGSVFKPITMAIGIDQDKVTPESTFIDTGSVYADGYVIQNFEEKTFGEQTMTQVLEESINTGVIHVEQLVGHTLFADYMNRFGFGAKTGVDLPFEMVGSIKGLENTHRNVEFYTASFGQGISMTPLQLAVAYGALANGGELMKPQIVEKKISRDGAEHVVEREVARRVISQETSEDISLMLESVVANGHAKRAGVDGYRVGGKTGTAQVAKSDARGYDDGHIIGTFAGYAPIDDPRFTVVVKINNPKKGTALAATTAAPTFGRVMGYLLRYYDVEKNVIVTSNQ